MAPPAKIPENSNFTMIVDFTSNHLDDLVLKVNYTGIPLTELLGCYDTYSNELVATDIDSTTISVEFPISTADLSAAAGLATYQLNCTATAMSLEDAAAAGAGASTAEITVTFDGSTVHSITMDLPAISEGETGTSTKITFQIQQTTLLSAKTVNAILAKAAEFFKASDSSFDLARFFIITQELITPSAEMAVTATTEPYVLLSVHVNDVSADDVDAAAADIAPALTELGYDVTIHPAEEATIMTKCKTECGKDCGLCLDGQACVSSDDCLSTCNDGKCGPNSAATASVVVVAIVSAIATAMLL
jgi:hypothetical protein